MLRSSYTHNRYTGYPSLRQWKLSRFPLEWKEEDHVLFEGAELLHF